MKAVVVGCGRVGAGVADELDRAGWQVLIIDLKSAAFDRLPASFAGTALRGDGTDEDVLRRAGAENADLVLALTEGDNRNFMAAQLGIEALSARKTVAKVNDPVRAEAYAHLGGSSGSSSLSESSSVVLSEWPRRSSVAVVSLTTTSSGTPAIVRVTV